MVEAPVKLWNWYVCFMLGMVAGLGVGVKGGGSFWGWSGGTRRATASRPYERFVEGGMGGFQTRPYGGLLLGMAGDRPVAPT